MNTLTRLSGQLDVVKADKWLLSALTWIPLVVAFIIWAVFAQGLARDLKIGIVDLDNTAFSQQLVRHYDASPSLKVMASYPDTLSASQALTSGDIYGYVVIPRNSFKQTALNQPPQVSAFVNTQYILIGRLINSALLQAQGTFNAQVEAGKALAKGDTTPSQALGSALPSRSQITPLFNSNTNYSQFLLGAVVPAIWQIAIVVGTVMVLAANLRLRGATQWLGQSPVRRVISSLAPYFPVFMLQGLGMLAWFYLGLKWPFHGNIGILFLAQILMVLACMIMGSLFFFISLDATRAMSFAGAFTAPSFAFMGITFPVTEMNQWAQAWRSMLPVSHYIEAHVYQSNYGASFLDTLNELVPMLGYLAPFLMLLILIKKKSKQVVL
ncbi:putative ABC-type multidrug transport system,permease component [Vibrio nigripulchritudo SFn27]|uniref:Putative ABC-type multidrug transport system, permease component n=1 Tax=Vibrio nigripulchritudo TaxID=28173 RepID=U4JYB5_9VIBR|nr:ABC transporter permease [Vibrio nigripulchritudo]CCN81419.1 putative ABC-type multidrug transport system,permease component [Vibrio nigripulchritudo BLFn1]CCN88909.1 putative ABC-type multidrug transport system,permease component [Vibrio nigripulchritudo SFn27]CCN96711.1 putative ABC-type multidrug transport system,permease component [Vibrio nigripulchritudo ENn2]CCO39121.1 putative ABC-type multidrug transport system,permease component [Vibrio nigripulchritudo SFn135]CCO54628.1 putative A